MTKRFKRTKRGGMFSAKRSPSKSPKSPRPPRKFIDKMQPYKIHDITNKSEAVTCGVYHFDCNVPAQNGADHAIYEDCNETARLLLRNFSMEIQMQRQLAHIHCIETGCSHPNPCHMCLVFRSLSGPAKRGWRDA